MITFSKGQGIMLSEFCKELLNLAIIYILTNLIKIQQNN